MYEGDIKIDVNGNTLISNNDFIITTDDINWITNMLITSPNSWKYYADLGVGIERYIGEQNNANTCNDIKNLIQSFFNNTGYIVNVNVYPYEANSTACYINFISATGPSFALTTAFNLDSGKLVMASTPTIAEQYVASSDAYRTSYNKYSRRR